MFTSDSIYIASGLLAMCQGDYTISQIEFQEAVNVIHELPDNSDQFPNQKAVCFNNLAVSHFFAGQPFDATACLETCFNSHVNMIFSTGLRNLATLYEFSASRQQCLDCLQRIIRESMTDDPEISGFLV